MSNLVFPFMEQDHILEKLVTYRPYQVVKKMSYIGMHNIKGDHIKKLNMKSSFELKKASEYQMFSDIGYSDPHCTFAT